MKLVFVSLLVLCFALTGQAAPLDEEFGYVDVRTGAHMFWVAYHVDQPGDWSQYPLILWLQGGPGASGVGYGNFEELGPYTVDLKLRPHAWTKMANVMFVDNPVGTGYSYVDQPAYYARDNEQIAKDLLEVVKSAFSQNKDMSKMPFYVFSESYGGKMAADFGLHLHQAIADKQIECNFQGVALGDSWISPMDFVNTWSEYLYYLGFLNNKGKEYVDKYAKQTQDLVDQGKWKEATDAWSATESAILLVARGINFYNVLATENKYKAQPHAEDLSMLTEGERILYENHLLKMPNRGSALTTLMNGKMAERWNIPSHVRWEMSSGAVFSHLSGDFMKPNIESVEKLLNNTGLTVDVLTGSLDLICDTVGTYRWIENMNYVGKEGFEKIKRDVFHVSTYSEKAGYVQKSGRLAVYTILRSGHMIPIDAPLAATEVVTMVLSGASKQHAAEDPIKEAAEKSTLNEISYEPVKPKKQQKRRSQNSGATKKNKVKFTPEQKEAHRVLEVLEPMPEFVDGERQPTPELVAGRIRKKERIMFGRN